MRNGRITKSFNDQAARAGYCDEETAHRHACLKVSISFLLLTLVLVHPCLLKAAEDEDSPTFSLRGFGTVGATHSSEPHADFVSTVFKPDGAGHTHNWSMGVDSRLGAQLDAQLTPKLSAVLQVIVEQNYDNTYSPHVEWANLKYQVTSDFSIRAGRIVVPAFLNSDILKVGYAYPWVRPPHEVYRLLPVTKEESIDAAYRWHIGEMTNTLQGIVGHSSNPLPQQKGYAKPEHHWGITNTVEYGSLTARIALSRVHLTVTGFNDLFKAFRQFGAQGNAIADRYDPLDKPFPFIGVGLNYDPGDWFVMSEWGHSNFHSILGEQTAWYASGGYRYGKVVPYLTYARIRTLSNTSDPGLDTTTLPGPAVAAATQLNAILNGMLGSSDASPVQQTISLGMRWDFMKNTGLKLQFDHTRLGAGSPGLLTNEQPGFQRGGSLNVFSMALDFVF